MRKVIPLLLILLFAIPEAEAQRRKHRRRGGFGLLEINSMTKGATVQVDGKEVGTIPLARPIKLRAGKHTLKITKRGYTEYLDVVTIRRKRKKTEDIDLLPFAGILIISSTAAQSRVFIDGKFVGNTPLDREVLAGEHSVRVRKPGHYDYIKTIRTVAGKEIRLMVALKAMPVGTTPYRPPPPPPPKWYEKWWVWATAAGTVVAVTLAIAIPVAMASEDEIEDFAPDHHFTIGKALRFHTP